MNNFTVAPEKHPSHKISEKYPSYESLKNDRLRKPTGATIVLVHPGETIEGVQGSLYGTLASAGSVQPPQGIASLAAILHENGYHPHLVDGEPLGLGADEVAKIAMSYQPKYIGITTYTMSIKVAAYICQRIKKIAKENGQTVATIVGGPHVTNMPKQTLERYESFDYGIRGEGEITIVEMIDALEHSEDVAGIPNLIFRDGDMIQMNSKRSSLEDMDELPLPAWDLLPQLDKYYRPAGDNLMNLPSCAIVTSRGCPGKCFFCNPRLLGSQFRGHSAEYVLKIFRHLHHTFGLRDVFIADDMFVSDRENVLKFCRLLKAAKDVKMTWSAFARVNYVDKELLKEMRSAGCWQVGYGLESGSQKILDIMNKEQTVAQMETAIRDAHEAGIIIRGLFMAGNFGETKETLEETIAFVKRNPIKDFHVTFFSPMPGTASFKLWKKYGRWYTDTSEGTTGTTMSSLHKASFIPHALTEEELIDYQKRLYRAFLKPTTLWYHFRKIFRPSLMKHMLRGGFAFISYVLFQKFSPSKPKK